MDHHRASMRRQPVFPKINPLLLDVIVARTEHTYTLELPTAKARHVVQWLRALSDGYVILDEVDPGMSIPGPVVIHELA